MKKLSLPSIARYASARAVRSRTWKHWRLAIYLASMLLSSSAWAQYTENVIYTQPSAADVGGMQAPYRDSAGNLYVVHGLAGANGLGWVLELSPYDGVCSPVSPGWCLTRSYSFQGFSVGDAEYPASSVVMDSKGNIYGASVYGGSVTGPNCPYGCGVIYELTPEPEDDICPTGSFTGNGWCETILYNFTGGNNLNDSGPQSPLAVDSQGNLYGTTWQSGPGEVFELSPPSSPGGAWTETVLYTFCSLTNCADGSDPYNAGVVLDSQGNLYGTTKGGGQCGGCGVVYELSPPSGGGAPWTETIIFAFQEGLDSGLGGATAPFGGVVFDSNGNLYGTTEFGGVNAWGNVYELSPPSIAGGSWTGTNLYSFCSVIFCVDGRNPQSGVVLDSQGNIYGEVSNTTQSEVLGYGTGAVYEISPPSSPGGAWTEQVLAGFNTAAGFTYGYGSVDNLAIDPQGNIYGGLYSGGSDGCYGNGCGVVFELSPGGSNLTSLTLVDTTYIQGPTVGDAVTFTATVTDYESAPQGSDVRRSHSRPNNQLKTRPATPDPDSNSSHRSREKRLVTPGAAGITGTITFMANGSPMGCDSVALTTSPGGASAQCTTSALPAGANVISATYSGNSSYNSGISFSDTYDVVPAFSSTTVSSNQNPTVVSASITFTATITGYNPTGTVSFMANGNSIGGCSAQPVISAKATCVTKLFIIGVNSITATYSGDSNNYGSISAAYSQTVRSIPRILRGP